MIASVHPMIVQEHAAMLPQPGAQCVECGATLRTVSLQLAGGAELLLAYWCPDSGCFRYGVHVHTFQLGMKRHSCEVPKTRGRIRK